MKRTISFLILVLLFSFSGMSQKGKTVTPEDSVILEALKYAPKQEKKAILKIYKKADAQTKEVLYNALVNPSPKVNPHLSGDSLFDKATQYFPKDVKKNIRKLYKKADTKTKEALLASLVVPNKKEKYQNEQDALVHKELKKLPKGPQNQLWKIYQKSDPNTKALLYNSIVGKPKKLNPKINADSLFHKRIAHVPSPMRKNLTQLYQNADRETKEKMVIAVSLPTSSKADLISNYEKNKEHIERLKREFRSLIPEEFILSIAFNPACELLNTPAGIDVKIFKAEYGQKRKLIKEAHNLDAKSPDLIEILQIINWNTDILNKIETLLQKANCFSIENGEFTTIGFAKNGFTTYAYKLAESRIRPEEQKKFTNGCDLFFYKEHVILEAIGGAGANPCFND